MAKKKTKSSKSAPPVSPTGEIINRHAAGIDIGAREIVAAVPSDPEDRAVRSFGTTNPDLAAIRDWLKTCGITTAVMESTGVYWMGLFAVLRDAGIEVLLVNASHVRHCPARKTDVRDAQWLMQLHTAGLLRGSFHPPEDIRRLRGLVRERADLVNDASRHLQRMQKALTEMNVQLHHVLSDIDGVSGLRIIEAILGGQRDAETLWSLRDGRCKTKREEALKALTGNWDEDLVARMGRSFGTWKHLQSQIAEVDGRVGTLLGTLDECERGAATRSTAGRAKRLRKGEMSCDVCGEARRIYGVDLEAVPGISTQFLATLLSEVGTPGAMLSNFKTAKHFSSWLGLCPDNRKSGGKVLSSKTRKVANRLATAFRLSAQALWRNESELGAWSRRMKARLGKAEGITATAHRLARIVYHLIATGETYDDTKTAGTNAATQARRIANLRKQAERLGLRIVAG